MVFGHNSNVTVGSETVHVQTEDRGVAYALIETTVHWKGRVLLRRSNKYKDLLPLDSGKEAVLKQRVDDQHRKVVEEIRSGALKLTNPTVATAAARVPAETLRVELTNARTWLSGRTATLQALVRDATGNPVASASVRARVEGTARPFEFIAQTGTTGIATLQFELPKLGGGDAALVIEAAHNGAQGQLRFQLRAKSKV